MDRGGEIIHKELKAFSNANKDQIKYIEKLGSDYFFYLMNCYFVLGNSSSGILEANLASKISINVGDRQHGRLRSKSVIDVPYCEHTIKNVVSEIEKIYSLLTIDDFRSPYFTEGCNEMIKDFSLSICKQSKISKVKYKTFEYE